MESKKCRIASFAICLIVTLMLMACTDSTPRESVRPLRIEWTYWPGYYPTAIAIELGLFEKHGVRVTPQLYQYKTKAIADFSAKKVDGAMFATGDILRLATEIPLKAVLITDASEGADHVVALPEISSVADLRGKRVSYTPGDFGGLFILTMLKQHGLTSEDVTLVKVYPEDVPEALEKGLIDAGNIWEPSTSKALAAGQHIIFSSAQTPGLIMDCISFHASVVKERPGDIRAFIKAWFEAVAYWQNNPQKSAEIIAQHMGLKPEDISAEGIKIYDLASNKIAFNRSQATTSVHASTQAYVDLFIAKGTLSTQPDLDELFDASFLE